MKDKKNFAFLVGKRNYRIWERNLCQKKYQMI